MYQVLVSIQGMILGVTHPIYNEPGLGGFESHERPGGGDGGGAAGGKAWHVHATAERAYDEHVQAATIQHGILAHLGAHALPEGFEENVRRHFAVKRATVMYRVRQWMCEAEQYRARHGDDGLNKDHVANLRVLFARLQQALEPFDDSALPSTNRAHAGVSEAGGSDAAEEEADISAVGGAAAGHGWADREHASGPDANVAGTGAAGGRGAAAGGAPAASSVESHSGQGLGASPQVSFTAMLRAGVRVKGARKRGAARKETGEGAAGGRGGDESNGCSPDEEEVDEEAERDHVRLLP